MFNPEIKVVEFAVMDVITASICNEDGVSCENESGLF